ncbi:MAG TPA: F0F1 ATP synthase subunit B [Bacteroidales bacterium]|nr:ATP synthase F0 subunit B [Bacteroidales bacterium]HRC88931.1 F0F1 ATP synthase subunit B [Bacteroidales bacterium]
MILASNLATPQIGTIFWTTLIFLIFFLLLAKFAWKPILRAVKAREEIIKSSLEAAAQAQEEMKRLKADNEAILKKAREERENILKEAREAREKIIADAREKATSEAEKILEKNRQDIEKEKLKALSEIHSQVAYLSVEIASKLLEEKLSKTPEQEKLIERYLNELNTNKN